MVQTNNDYVLGKSSLSQEIPELIDRLASEFKSPRVEVAKALFFPNQMIRASLPSFMDRGLMGLAGIGIGSNFADAIKRIRGKDVGLEASMFGQSIHIAHALDSTFIPHIDDSGFVENWSAPAGWMGDVLNFYRNFNSAIAAKWAANERRKIERKILLPAIPLFDFDRAASFDDVLKASSSIAVRQRGHGLISRLLDMPPDEREQEMARLIAELEAQGRIRRSATERAILLDAGISVGTYALGTSMFPVVPAMTLLTFALKAAKQSPSLDKIISELELSFEESANRNSDLSFMSKVDRVATIKRFSA